MDADEDDFVFYGTPIEREEEMTSRKKKAIAEASGNLRALPAWKQEVTDEEGRRRFHGAFTGGFSAGYYNTVGSKEGWTPQSFTSSRKKRAEVKEQSLYNFLDDDEKTELEGRGFGTSSLFDTFGFTAAEVAHRQAEKEVNKRPSAIPGPVPDELIAPSADSIGVKLLLKMGWRHGRAIKDSQSTSLYDARREARKAFLAFSSDTSRPVEDDADAIKLASDCATELDSGDFRAMFSRNTPVFVPKQDLYGLGYDPFRHAPEFRERKRLRASENKGPGSAVSGRKKLFSSNSGKVAPGFGIGALEELDVEDEDIYASGFEFEETYVDEVEEPTRTKTAKQLQLTEKKHGGISGFKLASNSDHQIERFNPPVIPPDFEPHHKFPAPLVVGEKFAETPPPVPPPEDNNLRLLIEGFATLVTRCGKLFENLSREKNKTNPLFSFLTGGSGHEYYARKLWEEQQKQIAHKHQIDDKSILPSVAKKKLTAETRGRILGEKPLERSAKELFTSANGVHLQLNNLSDTFTTPSSLAGLPEAVKPFKDDPAKQERFEQFLKDKYQGGLRSTKTGGANMSEADRARERLDFEAAAEAIQKGKQPIEIESTLKGQFVSGGLVQLSIPNIQEKLPDIKYPRREEYQWRPSPLLCKRFDIDDPFMGQPLPLQKARRRIDSLIFASDFPLTTSNAETVADRDVTPVSHVEENHKEVSGKEAEISDNPSVERPVDLYKAIFSDDSDDEDIVPNFKQEDNLEIKNEIANSTLNRLIAGDFLETLGKELGLEVPPDPLYYRTDKTNTSSYQKEAYVTPVSQKLSKNDQSNVICQGSEDFSRDVDGNWHNKESKSDVAETASSRHSETKCDKFTREGRVTVIDTSNEKKKRQDSRSSSFESDSSSDSGNRNRSRFREDKRDPLRKSSSKHSKRREHKHKRSRSRSRRHRSDREDSGNKREKTKSRTDKSRLRDDRSKSDPRKKQHH